MAENSGISWTDDTLNHWGGCQEVRLVTSLGIAVPSECDNCYARWHMLHRMGYNDRDAEHPVVWGPPKTTPRHRFQYVEALMPKLDKQAAETGRRLVFSFSLSDLFEEHPQLGPWRAEFFEWVERYTNLDYQFLTKRPQNVHRMVPGAWLRNWPAHVWLGTSAGTQEAMARRARYLAEARDWGARVTFLSMEPLLERTDPTEAIVKYGVNWLIDGGESGSDEGVDRPRINADLDWFRYTRDVAWSLGVPYFHKQHGGRRSGGDAALDGRLHHGFPDTGLGKMGGVRARPEAELIAV